jgi:hypothetical protein
MKVISLLLLSCLLVGGCAFPDPISETIVPEFASATPVASLQPTELTGPTATGTVEIIAEPTQLPPTLTATTAPTRTPAPTYTSAPPVPTATPDPLVYHLQDGTPVYSPNIFHPDLACAWTGVAGQVFGPDMRPVDNIAVNIRGEFAGVDANLIAVTGGATGFGEGGYEITLGNKPTDTAGSLWIQLFDINGMPISQSVPLMTSSTCAQALLIVNFVYWPQMPLEIYLPIGIH